MEFGRDQTPSSQPGGVSLVFFHRTSPSPSGSLPEMSDTNPPTKKMARLSLTKNPQRSSRISWKDIHDLITAAQAMCPPQAPLSSILLAVFTILHAKVIGTQDCPLEGCRTKIEIPLHPESISTIPSPFSLLSLPKHR